MPKVIYPADQGIYARVAALEERLRRVESGGVLTGAKVTVRAQNTGLVGPWPQSLAFTVANPTSTILIIWYGTGYNPSGTGISLLLKVDGTQVDGAGLSATSATNEHTATGSGVVALTGLAAGSHTAQIVVGVGTSDSGDRGHIVVLELPQ